MYGKIFCVEFQMVIMSKRKRVSHDKHDTDIDN